MLLRAPYVYQRLRRITFGHPTRFTGFAASREGELKRMLPRGHVTDSEGEGAMRWAKEVRRAGARIGALAMRITGSMLVVAACDTTFALEQGHACDAMNN